MRVDTTVVETNIHYPTDSSLLGDGVRVLIRTMKKVAKIVGAVGTKLCDRSRSVKLRACIRAGIMRKLDRGRLALERMERRSNLCRRCARVNAAHPGEQEHQ
jgi:IS5 family transposase